MANQCENRPHRRREGTERWINAKSAVSPNRSTTSLLRHSKFRLDASAIRQIGLIPTRYRQFVESLSKIMKALACAIHAITWKSAMPDKPNYAMADALMGIFGYRRVEPMKVPELPKHERFRIKSGNHEFSSPAGTWLRIGWMPAELLEDCCCIARCWWLDAASEADKSRLLEEYHRCNSNAAAWRDYYNERCLQ